MMRIAALVLIPAMFAAEPLKLPQPYQSLSDLASATPPELNADALLRMVESGKLADRNARRQLIEHAFQLAASAKFALRMEGVPGTTTDTQSGSLSRAYALKLDVLSLESRAVRDMLPLDAAKARELFAQIVKPTPAPLTCDDALTYEPTDYYVALGAVISVAFTAKEKAKDEPLNLLLDSIGQATSPSQIAPLASAIQIGGFTAAQQQLLLSRLGGSVEGMRADDRSASAALPGLSSSGLEPFAELLRRKNHACEAAAPASGAQTKAPPPRPDAYWQSTGSQQVLKVGKNLRFGSNTEVLSDADRATPDWQQRLADYLNLIAEWAQDPSESDAVYYHERCLVYTALLDLVPDSQTDKILAEYVDFVSGAALYQQNPAEWFSEPHTVLERAESYPARHAKILEAYEASGNPALMLTVALNRNFGTNLPSWAVTSR
jgi:hypothetical protein